MLILSQVSENFFSEIDLWEIQNAAVFLNESSRKIGRQMNVLSQIFGQAVIPVPSGIRKERHEMDSLLPDEGAYPLGGYSQISTQGNLESLIPSELMYMDEKEALDLFTIRYVEKDLIYFHREMMSSRRKKKGLCFFWNQYDDFSNHLFFSPSGSFLAKESRTYKASLVIFSMILDLIKRLEKIFPQKKNIYQLHLSTDFLSWEDTFIKLLLPEDISKRVFLSCGKKIETSSKNSQQIKEIHLNFSSTSESQNPKILFCNLKEFLLDENSWLQNSKALQKLWIRWILER
jgi:hypothetical protein